MMKTAFIIGLLAGFAGVLSAAHYYPWVDLQRLPSDTSVVANGGRAERFLIRLPADRISSAGDASAGVRGAPYPDGLALPDTRPQQPVLLEQFKLRDRAGDVIGLASRHWTETAQGPAAAWLLLLPGRGSIMLAAAGEAPAAVDAALASAGRNADRPWSGNVEVVLADGDRARIVGGSDEFNNLTGRYKETWAVTGAGAGAGRGELRGTITLDTITFEGQ